MNRLWFFLIAFVIVIITFFLWWIFYPIFRVIEVNDELPIEITTPKQSSQIQNIQFSNLNIYNPEETTNTKEKEKVLEDNNNKKQVSTIKESNSTPVIGVGGHNASGFVKIIKQGKKQYIRYENFSTIDGPELRVYLSNDLNAENYIDLGLRKGTRGNINYSIPDHIDLNDYKYVLHWCRPFRVLFNYADIEKIKEF